MIYREIAPSAPLEGLVHCFWVLEHAPDPEPAPEKILPDGRPELIFNLGAPCPGVGEDAASPHPTSFVVGQIRRFLEIVPTGRVAMIGVRLQPAALPRLFGGSASELTDGSLSLEDLGATGLRELEERLHAVGDWERRVGLVEEQLVRSGASGVTGIDAAVRLIRRRHGRLELARVAEAVGMSVRTLDRGFAAEVGLTPKLFSRLVRFQRVFELLGREPRPSWAEVSVASGCFDQAHLNREFRAFAGESPAAFLRSRHELSDRLTGLVT